MESERAWIPVHSQGEVEKLVATVMATGDASTIVDTLGRRVRVEWDPTASVTPIRMNSGNRFGGDPGIGAWVN